MIFRGAVAALLCVRGALALDDGFKLPGLYFSAWNHYGGSISDALLRECADAMVASGLRDAGYSGINLGQCPCDDVDVLAAIRLVLTKRASPRSSFLLR